MDRILVVKLADLGDVLTATPALRALRRRFPRAAITALVSPHTACLLEHNDAVDSVLVLRKAAFDGPRELPAAVRATGQAVGLARALRGRRFDAAVLLHHLTTPFGRLKYRALLAATGAPIRAGLDNGTGAFLTHRAPDRGFGARHEVEYGLDVVGLLGATHDTPRLELHLTADERTAGQTHWTDLGMPTSGSVLLHPGSGRFSVARRWAPANFAVVGDALAAAGLQVGIVAGPGEEALAEAVRGRMVAPGVVLRDLNSPRELAALLALATLFVGNDSGVLHCAAAMGVPSVGVFGLTNHLAWGPFPSNEHRVVRLDLPCSPCFYRGVHLGTPQGCPARTCLETLSPPAVIAAARSLLTLV